MKDNSDYDPREHPFKELFYTAISPVGWVILVIFLVLL